MRVSSAAFLLSTPITIDTRSSQIVQSGDSGLIIPVPEQAVATMTAMEDRNHTTSFSSRHLET